MTVTQWPVELGTGFFGKKKQLKDNTVITEMTGGRTVAFKRNTRDAFIITVSIKFSKQKEDVFWLWYNGVLGGVTGSFTCGAIGSGRFRFTEDPEPDKSDQIFTVLKFTLEEVF